MNNVVPIILRLLPTTVIGLLLNRTIIKTADDEMVFDDLIMAVIVALFSIALAWTIYKDNKAYKLRQSKVSFIPTIVGILFTASFFITISVLADRDKSPILIQAGYDGGFNGAWFEFREDGTYKFGNSSGIGATYSRGKYILRDSLITLDRNNIDNVIQSKLLVIRTADILDATEQVIYQINTEHSIIDREFKFTVNIDNRKK